MSIQNQLINYFEANQYVGGEFLYFDEMPLVVEKSIGSKKNKSIDNSEYIVASHPPTSNVPTPMHNDKLSDTLDELRAYVSGCNNCVLGTTRNSVVFGEGDKNAGLMVIGEAPGADEDEQGMPFVGRAGKLLTDILKAINFSREEVYIANICKCRPPGNRKPQDDEIATCEPYLHKQIDLIKPKFILALGLTAAEALFKQSFKMGDIRGKVKDYHGIKTLITYHPAALLRNPAWKRPVWEDVQLLRKMYDNELKK